MTTTLWGAVFLGALILSYFTSYLVYVWISKPETGVINYNFENSRFNQRLWWTSYTVFLILGIFLLPTFYKKNNLVDC